VNGEESSGSVLLREESLAAARKGSNSREIAVTTGQTGRLGASTEIGGLIKMVKVRQRILLGLGWLFWRMAGRELALIVGEKGLSVCPS
jgi:hypothetical protein